MRKGIAQKLFLGGATAAAMLLTVGTAQAVEFKFGEMSLVIDNTASIGVGVRTSKQNCSNVNSANGGCGTPGPAGSIDFGVNDDDGNVNTDQWDLYSTPVKLTTDFEMKWRNYGAFARTKLFYDHWVYEEIGTRNNRFGARPITDAARGDKARRFGGRGADLLDAYVYGNFDVAGNPVTLRAGKQVINFGESLFIPGGISSYLPVDISALRTPGSELKEAFLPVPALYGSIGLPGNMQVEAFWQFGWERTRLDACGTFFSGTDAVCEGGKYVMNAGEYPGAAILIPRQASEEGDDTGTFGVAVKHYAEWLGAGTDLGLYFVRQSLTAPVGTFTLGDFAGTVGAPNLATFCAATGTPGPVCLSDAAGTIVPGVSNFFVAFVGTANTKNYLTQYVNDVESYGFSFNTSIPLLGGSAFSGELNYTPDMPFALNDVDQNCHDLNAIDFGAILGAPGFDNCRPGAVAPTGPGATIQGYDFRESITGQVGTISTLSGSQPLVEMIGGDILILVANVGFQYIPNLDSATNRLSIPRAASFNPNPFTNQILASAGCAGVVPFGPTQCTPKYADSFSWGYRLLTSVDYNNALGTPWTLSPSIAWSHDVSGYSAGPVGPGFVQGKKVVSLGLTANLRSVWRANVQYTHNMGNEFRNFSKDKDFMSMTVSYAF
ncbi:MAG: DUF1302 domain-containing protein [Parvibaculum sp.]|nr:DUF1302 domain-containing protein [Parvibaculum sp.]